MTQDNIGDFQQTYDKFSAEEQAAIKQATIKRSVRTGDGVVDPIAQIGVGADNTISRAGYNFNPITRNRALMDWIYRGSWLGGQAVDLVAEDMTREGIEIHSDNKPEDIEAIQTELVRLDVWGGVQDTVKWGRLYGGSIGVYLIDGQDVSTPLNLDTIRKGGFKGILALDRWMLDPSLNDRVQEYGPHLGKPKYYTVTGDAPALAGAKIHYSRCFRIEGIKLPYWSKVQENLWGLSIYERMYDRMVAFDSGTMGVAQLLSKIQLRVISIKGLRELFATGGPLLAGLQAQMAYTRDTQTSEGLTIIDGEDVFTPHHTNISGGVSDALLQLAQQLSGALQIPLVRLLGQSPAGLNATGESDMQNYYDGIQQQQNKLLYTPVHDILHMVAASKGITLPDNFSFTFKSLWEMTDDEKSTINQRDTLTILEAKDRGIISDKTVLQELRSSGRATGRWSNITDEMLEEADDELPDLSEMMPGMGGDDGTNEALPLKSFSNKAVPKPTKAKAA